LYLNGTSTPVYKLGCYTLDDYYYWPDHEFPKLIAAINLAKAHSLNLFLLIHASPIVPNGLHIPVADVRKAIEHIQSEGIAIKTHKQVFDDHYIDSEIYI